MFSMLWLLMAPNSSAGAQKEGRRIEPFRRATAYFLASRASTSVMSFCVSCFT